MAGGFRGLQRGAVTAEADSAILREPSLAFPKHGAKCSYGFLQSPPRWRGSIQLIFSFQKEKGWV